MQALAGLSSEGPPSRLCSQLASTTGIPSTSTGPMCRQGPLFPSLPLSSSLDHASLHTHTHFPCTCCHGVINGIHYLKICSHADFLILSLPLCQQGLSVSLLPLYFPNRTRSVHLCRRQSMWTRARFPLASGRTAGSMAITLSIMSPSYRTTSSGSLRASFRC